jgi:twinkle protein
LIDNEYTYEYLEHRGIEKGTFSFYGVKSKIRADGVPLSLGFAYPNGSHKVRLLDHKEFYWDGPSIGGLYATDRFDSGTHKYVTITEGELDALSLWQVLKTPVVSVQSSSTAKRDCIADRVFLSGFDRIYLAFDNDTMGREAAASVAKLFDVNKVYLVKFDRHKDANDYLQAGEGEQLRHIWWNARKYQPETIVSTLADFKTILSEKPKTGVLYPFPCLNEKTYGIRTGETVLITAPEGVGKTELMHTIEYQLLKETAHDVGVGAIYLEEPKKRHLQALAGIHLRKPVHLPDCDCTENEVYAAVESLVGQDDRLNLYSHYGSDDPEVLLDTIRWMVSARNCRYILLDLITLVVSGLAGEKERTALDYFSTRSSMMAVELDFAFITVSHQNDEKQTRGSRLIAKNANIRIDISRDLLALDSNLRNRTDMVVSKNRFCGRTGFAGSIDYSPITGIYTEASHDVQ